MITNSITCLFLTAYWPLSLLILLIVATEYPQILLACPLLCDSLEEGNETEGFSAVISLCALFAVVLITQTVRAQPLPLWLQR